MMYTLNPFLAIAKEAVKPVIPPPITKAEGNTFTSKSYNGSTNRALPIAINICSVAFSVALSRSFI